MGIDRAGQLSGIGEQFQLKKIPDMCLYIMQYEEEIRTRSTDQEAKDCYQKHVNYCRKVNVIQFLATLASCFFFALVALLQVFACEDFTDKPFMHDMWFPFRRERHMPIVIFICLFVDTQGVIFNTYTQTTFIGLMIYASARLEILQVKLRKFDEIAAKQYNGDVLFTVKQLIVEHRDIIGFVQSLNDRTKYVMLLEYILNSVCLATGLIQLIVADTASGLLSLFCIIFLVVTQIFILAWSANEICVASLGVADAIFASNWTEHSNEVKKLLLIMIMRAQVPIGLTAGPFFQMRTNTALTTVKIAYSYVSFMAQSVR